MHGLVFLWTGCFAQNLQCLWHGGNPTHRPPTACGAAAYGLVSHLFKHWWGLCLNSSMQLVDSFCFFCFCFIFSHTDEDFFVWTVQGNLLIPFFIFLISSHTDEVFEQFKGTCWLIFSPICSHADEDFAWTVQGNLLTHFFLINSHTDEDFVWTVQGNLVDSFFTCSHADEDFAWTVQGILVDSFFICSHADEDFVWTVQSNWLLIFHLFSHRWKLFEQLKATCWLVSTYFYADDDFF